MRIALAGIVMVMVMALACSSGPAQDERPTATSTPEPTATADSVLRDTATPVPNTPTPEPPPPPLAATATPEPTATSLPEPTATATPEPTPTPTSLPEPTATSLPEPTATATPEPTATAVPEPTPTPEPTATAVPEPTATATPEPAVVPTVVVVAAQAVPVATLAPPTAATLTPTSTPTPTATALPPPATPTAEPTSMLWRGLVVSPEHRCAPYDADDYPYPQSVEERIIAAMGGIIYGPYTGTYFSNRGETDIEHIVARSEAHDSGLCAADAATRRRFSGDLLGLTLASPSVNRHQKIAYDAAEWLPDFNQCWYADRIVRVRQKYGLTIDQREADALDAVIAGCSSFEMVEPVFTPAPAPTTTPTPGTGVDALAMWDDNNNGRITCAEARAHGIAPVRKGHPAYEYMDDRDNDGVVCE